MRVYVQLCFIDQSPITMPVRATKLWLPDTINDSTIENLITEQSLYRLTQRWIRFDSMDPSSMDKRFDIFPCIQMRSTCIAEKGKHSHSHTNTDWPPLAFVRLSE